MKKTRAKRFWKMPPEIVARFHRLLSDTDWSIRRCAVQAGLGESYGPYQTVRRYSGSRGPFRTWVDLPTGERRPRGRGIYTVAELARQSGLSAKTVRRRLAAGLIRRDRNGLFSVKALERLVKTGKLLLGMTPSKLSLADVRRIFRLRSRGWTVTAISKEFPQVTRKQVYRVLNGERWANRI